MLIIDFSTIGNKLYEIRKKMGFTQADVAEASELSTRSYADIERGSVNMRIETLIKICKALHITPNELFVTEDFPISQLQNEIWDKLNCCSPKTKATALKLLSVYLNSLN